jgi:hypothetical protein
MVLWDLGIGRERIWEDMSVRGRRVIQNVLGTSAVRSTRSGMVEDGMPWGESRAYTLHGNGVCNPCPSRGGDSIQVIGIGWASKFA